jgi:hypothetical protein
VVKPPELIWINRAAIASNHAGSLQIALQAWLFGGLEREHAAARLIQIKIDMDPFKNNSRVNLDWSRLCRSTAVCICT